MDNIVERSIVREWLDKYREALLSIDAQAEMLRRLTNRLEQVSSPQLSDIPRAPSPDRDRLTDAIARKDRMKEQIADRLKFMEDSRKVLDRLLEECNLKSRLVIQMHDLSGMDWNEIAATLYHPDEMATSEARTEKLRELYRYRRNGVWKMAEILSKSDGTKYPTILEISEQKTKKII